jgi:hypothetical protein
MGHGRLDPILGSYSILGIDFSKNNGSGSSRFNTVQGLCKSTLLYLALGKGSGIEIAENKDSRDPSRFRG